MEPCCPKLYEDCVFRRSHESLDLHQPCYSTGSVFYTGATNPTAKGFIGTDDAGAYSSNFWDNDVSNQTTAIGATGKTTVQIKTESTFRDAGWEFTINGEDDDWKITISMNSGYPHLVWAVSSSFSKVARSQQAIIKLCGMVPINMAIP
jgi:hypothetical protein